MPSIYLIGSLRNARVPEIAARLRAEGYEVFDDWYAAGPEADDYWQKYEKARGRTYKEAIAGYASKHVVKFDYTHLNRCDVAVLLLPAGRSGHLEAGYQAKTKPVFVLFEGEPKQEERWDQMYALVFENGGSLCFSEDELVQQLRGLNEDIRERVVSRANSS